jgi:cleavage stimulation factor subunit 3
MEYHVSKATDVASRIFEKGMETFGEEIDYVLRYLGFLISVNDNNSEPLVTTFTPVTT